MNFTFNYLITVSFKIFVLGIVIYVIYINIKNKQSGYIPFVVIFLLYLYYIIASRSYLENFSDISNNPMRNNDVVLDSVSKPFYDKPINSLSDYEDSMLMNGDKNCKSQTSDNDAQVDDNEYNVVFNNETEREISDDTRNKLMSQYPMDWTVNPPSSTNFVKGTEKEKEKSNTTPDTSMYDNIEGNTFVPPNMDDAEMKERKALKTYVPKGPRDMKTYNVDDAYTIIKNIYDAKGLEPEVEHKKDTNIYEIIGTRRKDEKVQYEDDLGDAEASEESVPSQNESITVVPQATKDYLYDSDPFYNTATRTRTGRHDYTKFTPELERMFAPTYTTTQWY